MIVIHGPMGSGKTFHGKRFAEHYGCARVLEAEDRHEIQQATAGDLILTYDSAEKAARRFPEARLVTVADARIAIGEEAVWIRTAPDATTPVPSPLLMALPVKVGEDGEIVDAAGRLLLIIDVDRQLPDDDVATIQRIVASSLNARGGQKPTCDRVEALAARMAAKDGLIWDEECGYEAEKGECGSGTCIAAHFEDHDPDAARGWYKSMARAAFDALVNTPETIDFMIGVPLEATHQRERWAADNDAGKTPFDWFWLIGYLAQKAAAAAVAGDADKARHHTISTAAALANWHAALTGADTAMRPGVAPSANLPESTNSKGGL
ncbi:hypothetical protein [Sphingomonas melonis]|uniref:hypothetical protein n=1 Tax=Sphingomonas melonis TaxID=152682 RepID=UPI0003819DF8|nr:hypothetical protein [Sphingomonas melonis]